MNSDAKDAALNIIRMAARKLPAKTQYPNTAHQAIMYQLRRLGRFDIGLSSDPSDGKLWVRRYRRKNIFVPKPRNSILTRWAE